MAIVLHVVCALALLIFVIALVLVPIWLIVRTMRALGKVW